MATKPTTTYTWDENETNTTQPALAIRDDGVNAGDLFAAANANYQFNSISQWLAWSELEIDSTAGSIPTFRGILGNMFNATSSGTAESLNGIATDGNGTIVACGNNGAIIYSTNHGKTWSVTVPTGDDFYAITYRSSGTIWTAVGEAGMIRTALTSDLTTWTSRTSNATGDLKGVYDDGTTIVAVSATGEIRYQTNPTGSWSTATPAVGGIMNSVKKGTSNWIIVGESGRIQTASTPSGTWTQRTSGTSQELFGVGFGNSTFVVGGEVTGGQGTLLISTDDGLTWSSVTDGNPSNNRLTKPAYNSNSGLWCLPQFGGYVLFSGDATHWIAKQVHASNNFSMVAYGAKKFHLVGAGGITYYSDDFETLRDDIDTNTTNIATNTTDIATRASEIDSVDVLTSLNRLTNIQTFTDTEVTTMTSTGQDIVYHTNAGTNYLVTVGTASDIVRATLAASGTIAVGQSWTSQNAAVNFNNVAADSSFGLAVAPAGALYSSPAPLTTWTSRTSGTAENLNCCAAGGSNYVAAGNNNAIVYRATSPEGNFSSATSGLDGTTTFVSMAYGAGLFVLITTDNEIITSPTGVTWTSRTNPTTATWTKLTYDGARFWAFGASGKIISSTDGITWADVSVSSGGEIIFASTVTTTTGATFYLTMEANATWYRYGTTIGTWTYAPLDTTLATINDDAAPAKFVPELKRVFYTDTNGDLSYSRKIL